MIFKKKFTNKEEYENINELLHIDWNDVFRALGKSSDDVNRTTTHQVDTYTDQEFVDLIESACDAILEALGAQDEKNDKEPLKSCPICGSTCHTEISLEEGKWRVECSYCPLETIAIFETEEEAIDYWNDRV